MLYLVLCTTCGVYVQDDRRIDQPFQGVRASAVVCTTKTPPSPVVTTKCQMDDRAQPSGQSQNAPAWISSMTKERCQRLVEKNVKHDITVRFLLTKLREVRASWRDGVHHHIHTCRPGVHHRQTFSCRASAASQWGAALTLSKGYVECEQQRVAHHETRTSCSATTTWAPSTRWRA